ncbi:RecB family exonuclease, partial [Couchioplanes caeruleus]
MTAETVLSPSEPGLSTSEGGLSPSGAGPSPSGPDRDRHAGPSLSPSRAADFKTCPLLFRFRTVDRLPEQPSRDQVRGTLVHAVLERLFDLPAPDRTPEAAAALVAPQWDRLVAEEPGLSALFGDDGDAAAPVPVVDRPAGATVADGETEVAPVDGQTGLMVPSVPSVPASAMSATLPGMPEPDEAARLKAFLASTGDLLDGYFAVEDPRRLEPAERESLVSTLVDEELLIRGYIDRLDVSPAGDLRVVDYKTGGAPREAFEGRALFQLKFYALVLWRTRGVVPRVLRLLYLKDAEVCDYSPDADELERFERTLVALSQAIERAKQERDFRPKPSRLCGWCSHQRFCPEFGGTPPPYPEPPTGRPTDPTTDIPTRTGTDEATTAAADGRAAAVVDRPATAVVDRPAAAMA